MWNTGMQRLGFPFDVALEALGGVEVGLLVTHLACADVPKHPC